MSESTSLYDRLKTRKRSMPSFNLKYQYDHEPSLKIENKRTKVVGKNWSKNSIEKSNKIEKLPVHGHKIGEYVPLSKDEKQKFTGTITSKNLPGKSITKDDLKQIQQKEIQEIETLLDENGQEIQIIWIQEKFKSHERMVVEIDRLPRILSNVSNLHFHFVNKHLNSHPLYYTQLPSQTAYSQKVQISSHKKEHDEENSTITFPKIDQNERVDQPKRYCSTIGPKYSREDKPERLDLNEYKNKQKPERVENFESIGSTSSMGSTTTNVDSLFSSSGFQSDNSTLKPESDRNISTCNNTTTKIDDLQMTDSTNSSQVSCWNEWNDLLKDPDYVDILPNSENRINQKMDKKMEILNIYTDLKNFEKEKNN